MSAVSGGDEPMGPAGAAGPRKRADARKNEQTLVAAAAEAFVAVGVEAPDRDIATRAGVGMGTIYRHFPTRADLVIAVYRHQVEACAQAGPALHGLAAALQSGDSRFEPLHAYFLDRLVPVCAQLLGAAVAAGEIGPGGGGLRAHARHRQPLHRRRG